MCGIWAIFGIPDFPHHSKHAMHISGRGPDCFRMETVPHLQNCCLLFHRLAIVDDLYGMQPMRVKKFPHLYLIYNGEIYNYQHLGEKHGFEYFTKCDGEVILHLYDAFGAEKTAQLMDGVFAFCIVDTKRKEVHLGRDTFGVRPMFTLSSLSGEGPLALCSEAKGLVPVKKELDKNGAKIHIKPFPPGHTATYTLTKVGKTALTSCKPYTYIGKTPTFDVNITKTQDDHHSNIRAYLTEAVRKRLMADRRIGCLLSGGLDSSLVASLLTKLAKENGISYQIQTFSIGMDGSPDVEAARKVAAHIGSDHHEVAFTPEQGIQAVREVIYALETYDITTIRASVGMYLVSRYINENTDTTVVYSGEGADELCQGYIYFHKAPSALEADEESRRLLKDLYYYDVLRSDRTISKHGLEVRVPFLDASFTSFFLSLPPELRQPKNGVEKWVLRKSFEGTGILPYEILWRPKEAFSDGVSSKQKGKSWFEILQRHCQDEVSDEELFKAAELYPFNTPKTKESFYYRKVFEEFFEGQSHFIPYFWMPKWSDATDPSARVLSHYK